MSRSKLLSNTTLFVFAVLFVLAIPSCKKGITRAKAIPDSVKSYVYAYTTGVISKNSPIKIRFAGTAVNSEKVGSEAGSILSFKPSISGTAIWEDDHTLRFEPKNAWDSGTSYVAEVALDKVFNNLPPDAESFEFDFLIKEQNLAVEVYGLAAEDMADYSKQNLVGVLTTNDAADEEAIQSLLSAKQKGKSLNVEWEHDATANRHYFTVAGVDRDDKTSEVEIAWNGNDIGVEQKDKTSFTVPSKDEFVITSARVEDGDNQQIVLHFSDPLSNTQNLSGLLDITKTSPSTDEYGYYNEPPVTNNLNFVVEGNSIIIYPGQRLTGTVTVEARPGIRNTNGKALDKPAQWQLNFEPSKPKVRLVGKGVILPNSDNGLVLPFEAINLEAVDVEIFKIYNNNIHQFLQTNDMDGTGDYDLFRVGRVLKQVMVPLKGLNKNANQNAWSRYALDLSELFKADPDAIYQVRIGFRPEYANINCKTISKKKDNMKVLDQASNLDENGEIRSIWGDYYGIEGYYDGWEWYHRENPCYPAYYNYDNFALTNVFASDLGIIAKSGKDGSFFVAVSNLRTTRSESGVALELYDFPKQLLGTAKTNSDGIAELTLDKPPFLIIAKKEKQRGFLKTTDGNSLSLSRFDVSGTVNQKGLKGYLYAERGVWRPGDSIHLNFILEDKTKKLPTNYPVSFEVQDARGQIQFRTVSTKNTENIYPLSFGTTADAPTGSWIARVKAGGATFEKTLRVETVKPNRLKIDLGFGGKQVLSARNEPVEIKLGVNWLHGAPGQNLRSQVELEMKQQKTEFPKFKNYVFDDPARILYPEPVTIYDGMTNKDGKSSFVSELFNQQNQAPGMLQANFRVRAYEKGGDFSTWITKIPYSPYNYYSGISIPSDKFGAKELKVGENNTIKFAATDEKGNPAGGRNLSIGIYRIEWRWWWDSGDDYVSNYNSGTHFNATETAAVRTGADGSVSYTIKPDSWGRYLVRVCDTQSGHCSGDFFNAGYPWYDGDSPDAIGRKEAAMMSFAANKEKYSVGEEIQINVPSGEEGRVLITLETGSKIIQSFWKDAKKGENTFKFKATAEMSPTVYASVSLVQPHGQVKNDLPIRMYGVLALDVENPKTLLKPVIAMPAELKPLQEFTVEVKEENNRNMAYTLAVVDEGLLGLTNFGTPDPHGSLYAREALGIKTWDVYDHVLGAFGGEMERILSIGGDAEINVPLERKNANRFKPVVMSIGPFYLNGGKNTHKLTMPNYVGSVRVMVVAANSDAAYGNAEKIVPVKKPLMVLATLPRVLGPGETLRLPVNVFAMDAKVKSVDIKVQESSGLVSLSTGNRKAINFSRPGDETVYFDLKVGEATGVTRFKITATGGGETAVDEIEVDVRNPNPVVANVYDGTLQPGETWSQGYEAFGTKGSNNGILEVSALPPLHLGERLNFLLQYPHGCVEQVTSAAFPQLYVGAMMKLTEPQNKQAAANVTAAITKLNNYQQAQGGFAYWPGGEISGWGTNYAGHFLLEAKNAGYNVPSTVIDRFVKYQQQTAKRWSSLSPAGYQQQDHELEQAYRLYTLALARKAELSAMNRMREMKNLSASARWRLAAAYSLAGKADIGKELVNNVPTTVEDYNQLAYTYGSALRDESMILETQVLLGDQTNAAVNARHVAEELGRESWYSTQTTAYSLLALGKFLGKSKISDQFTFSYSLSNGKFVNAGSSLPVMQIEVPLEKVKSGEIQVKNTSNGVLYSRLVVRGQPLVGDATSTANHIQINVRYTIPDGTALNPASLPQGTDFIAEVIVAHKGTRAMDLKEMALTQIFPSGWEIINTRLHSFAEFSNTSVPEYQDIRDDRVNTYFDLNRNTRQIYRVRLNAAYQGKYYLPSVSCEAMYDNSINARVPGMWVSVVGGSAI